jgi:RimJ/RimL family protein N-acetyltransferase
VSSRFIVNADQEVKAWAGIKLGTEFAEPCRAIGITNRHSRLIGAVIFNDFQEKNVEASFVGKGAFRKDVCRALARFAFLDLDCERVSITIRATNELVIGLAIKAGWRCEGRKRRYFGDDDAIIMGMLRKECPFLEDTSDE